MTIPGISYRNLPWSVHRNSLTLNWNKTHLATKARAP